MKMINKTLIAAALTTALTVGSAMAQPAPDETQRLQKKVRHELIMMPYFSVFDNMSYRIDNGVVTLMGDVTRPTLKSDAQRIVSRIEGVRGVVNNVEVLPLSPFDDRIRMATYRAIYGYGPLQRYGLGTQPSIRIIVKMAMFRSKESSTTRWTGTSPIYEPIKCSACSKSTTNCRSAANLSV